MQNLRVLNRKEIKELFNKIKEQYGIEDMELEYVFLRNNEGKIFIANRDIARIDLNKVKVNNIGLYFCAIENGEARLTIEGTQIIGKQATKNVVELNSEQVREWFKGEDIELTKEFNGFVILKYNNDFLGSGKYKNNKIINFLPKERRINI